MWGSSSEDVWVKIIGDAENVGSDFYWSRKDNTKTWKLPAGQEAHWVSQKTADGNVYFWHDITGETVWELKGLDPEGARKANHRSYDGIRELPPRDAEGSENAANGVDKDCSNSVPDALDESDTGCCSDGSDWVELRTENGVSYYWCRRHCTTTWELPPGIEAAWIGERASSPDHYYWHRATRVSVWDLPGLQGQQPPSMPPGQPPARSVSRAVASLNPQAPVFVLTASSPEDNHSNGKQPSPPAAWNQRSVEPEGAPWTRMVWLDLEMTSSIYDDACQPAILEAAVIITDKELREIARGHWVIEHSAETLAGLSRWHQSNFGETSRGGNGLFDEVLGKSAKTKIQSEAEILNLIKAHCPERGCPLAGNSVHCDREVLRMEMPLVYRYLSHRIIDVSTIFSLADRWFPERLLIPPRPPKRRQAHRAMVDVEDSIEYLRWARKFLFLKPVATN